jgi:hypothetical protein
VGQRCANISNLETGLLTDSDWSPLDGEPCRVTTFRAMGARMEGTNVRAVPNLPYASIQIESPKLVEATTAFIAHKLDFQHLWQAFNVRGVDDDEEVIVAWNKKGLKRPYRWLSAVMPRLRLVWVCPKDAYDLIIDPTFKPELQGLERHKAMEQLAKWEPDVFLK